jgi:copper chaperone CopZ
MKRYFAKAVSLSILTIFLAIGVTFAQDNLSTAIFKVDTKNKEAKVKIETIVNMLKGVSEAEMDLKSKRLEVKYDATQIQEDMILFAIQTLGYPASIERESVQKDARMEKSKVLKDSTKK